VLKASKEALKEPPPQVRGLPVGRLANAARNSSPNFRDLYDSK